MSSSQGPPEDRPRRRHPLWWWIVGGVVVIVLLVLGLVQCTSGGIPAQMPNGTGTGPDAAGRSAPLVPGGGVDAAPSGVPGRI